MRFVRGCGHGAGPASESLRMRPLLIAPSILSADFGNLQPQVGMLGRAGCDYIHVDVMDGRFVPNITIGQPVVAALRRATDRPLDVHLMIEQPDRHLQSFADAGADIITVHAEACSHLHRTLQSIRGLGKKAGVALNPATPLDAVRWVLREVDMILLMSVNPGFGGQKFIPATLDKLRQLREMIVAEGGDIDVEVDGGIVLENAGKVVEAGANVLVSGTGILATSDCAKTIEDMRRRASEARQRAPEIGSVLTESND